MPRPEVDRCPCGGLGCPDGSVLLIHAALRRYGSVSAKPLSLASYGYATRVTAWPALPGGVTERSDLRFGLINAEFTPSLPPSIFELTSTAVGLGSLPLLPLRCETSTRAVPILLGVVFAASKREAADDWSLVSASPIGVLTC